MIKLTSILLFLSLYTHASLLDFMTITKGEEAYHDSNYTEAIQAYSILKDKNDEAKYNLANSYYKAKKYKEAKNIYTQIKIPSLAFNKWHNLGNCEANLGNIDKGIQAYEKALKIKKDKDTLYNLELLKKKKQEKEKKKKQQKNKDKKEQKKQQNSQKKKQENKNKNKKQNEKKGKKDKDKGEQKTPKKEGKSSKNKKQEKKKKQEKPKQMQQTKAQKKMKEDEKNKTKASLAQASKKEPISDKEVQKYLKMLDKRGVNTLLVPLNAKGDKDEETTPW